jgi:hypothetical protein
VNMTKSVALAFDPHGVIVPIDKILPLKQIKSNISGSQKYQQVLSSVREIGIIEPLVVYPQKERAETYILLDGHIRLAVLKQLGETSTRCLIATDDETYTYNKRVNRMPIIQEHAMILKATRNGVSEGRIAKVLKVEVSRIRQKRDLLNGICTEAAEILKTRHVTLGVFKFLKKMKPMRQIEAAELLSAACNFSVPYAKALFVATPADMLLDSRKPRATDGLSSEQVIKMEKEMEVLQRDLHSIQDTHGTQVLNLVLACGYLSKLFTNTRVARYLGQTHADIFSELKTISEASSLEN